MSHSGHRMGQIKYLFYFGYNGKLFGGLQKQSVSGKNDNSVGKYLDESLRCLTPLNIPVSHVAGRTDAGVHAICSAFTSILILPPHSRNKTREGLITLKLNKFFVDLALDIRIHKTLAVPLGFDCRKFPSLRTYLYRIAWVRTDKILRDVRLPIGELGQCLLLEVPVFDYFNATCACELLKGTHDFRNFATRDKTREQKTVRTINEIKIVPGKPLFDASTDQRYKDIQFFDIIVSSKGFLYNQVRRIVGAIINVATGRISLDRMQYYLYNPTERMHFINVLEPQGLFLQGIAYPQEAFLEETYADEEKFQNFLGTYRDGKPSLSVTYGEN